MKAAYIVIPTEAGKSREVARQIARLPGVKMADACWGSPDVFAILEVAGTKESAGLNSPGPIWSQENIFVPGDGVVYSVNQACELGKSNGL